MDASNTQTRDPCIASPDARDPRSDNTNSKFSRFACTLLRLPALLSLLAAAHFGLSLFFWSAFGLIVIRSADVDAPWLWLTWGAAPAVFLFVTSLANLLRSIRNRRFVTVSTIAIYLISACLFWYDVANKRAQLQVGIATVEYWQNGGSRFTYLTWWWYNDGWFRRHNKALNRSGDQAGLPPSGCSSPPG